MIRPNRRTIGGQFKVALTVLAMTAGVSAANAQSAKLIEKHAPPAGSLGISYERYELPNGLTVLVHEDHSDPIVHVDMTYHVGSAREERGKSGFAHFFEHMMFQGSDNVADEEHFKMVTAAGGTMNGTTNRDRTNYFETLPSGYLETALWLEADRMGFLLDAVTQQKFEVQRATVKNERGQRYDNVPYGLAMEKMASVLYPDTFPYNWLTIGYVEDLNRVNVEDLKQFFLRYYGPNNATLTVAGDVKPADVVRLAEKYFGSIAKGPEVKPMKPLNPTQMMRQDRYVSYEDNVRFPRLTLNFPISHQTASDRKALEVLAGVLGQGENSILYQTFEKPGKVRSVQVFPYQTELAGELQITLIAFPDTDLKKLEQELRTAIATFEQRQNLEEDVARYKESEYAGALNSLSTVSSKASQLAYSQTFLGHPYFFEQDRAAVEALTAEDVKRAFKTYVKSSRCVVLSIVPKGQLAKSANPVSYVAEASPMTPRPPFNLKYNKAKDNFNRSQKPPVAVTPAVKAPSIEKGKTKNKITYLAARSTEIPMTVVGVRFKGGSLFHSADKGGLAGMTGELLNEDTQKRTSEEMAKELERLGANVSIGAGQEWMEATLQVPTKNLKAAMALLEERLLMPKFTQESFDRIKKNRLEGLKSLPNQATALASRALDFMLYPGDNPNGISVTTKTINNITLADVENFYKATCTPDGAQILMVSDLEAKDVMGNFVALNSWKGKSTLKARTVTPAKVEKTIVYIVDKPGAPQSEIRVSFPGMPYDATGNYFKATLMNYPLGGAFNSRINLNLREEKGWTYGARGSFSGDKRVGTWISSTGVKAPATDSAVIEILKELDKFAASGPTDEEMNFMRSAVTQADALKYETSFQKLVFIERMMEYGLEPAFVQQQMDITKNMTKAQAAATAKQLLSGPRAIVVVGDMATYRPKLEKLGYPVVEIEKAVLIDGK